MGCSWLENLLLGTRRWFLVLISNKCQGISNQFCTLYPVLGEVEKDNKNSVGKEHPR